MRLVLSGGGTGGHIIPNIALIHELRERYSLGNNAPTDKEKAQGQNLELLYIGTANSMEQKLMEELRVPFYAITCGKLRRYFSLHTLVDFFKIPIGIVQAFFKLSQFRPQAIFCKGGYVCFPVAVAGRLLRIPVFLHESDVTPGLANRLSARFAHTICISFEESRRFFPGKKVILTGNPVRRELQFGTQEEGLKFADFNEKKPVLLVMGGSLGAQFINEVVWRNLDHLLLHYNVVHICGQGKLKSSEDLLKLLSDSHKKNLDRYRAFSFVEQELKHLYALADVVVGRAGAIFLSEIDFFDIPAVLIPLPKSASRGDQIENAEVFAKTHLCEIISQENFEDKKIFMAIEKLFSTSRTKEKAHHLLKQNGEKNKFAPLEKIIHLLETA